MPLVTNFTRLYHILGYNFFMKYDCVVVGAGAAGMLAAISAAKDGSSVILLEKLSKVGSKLKATGGGRCNLTNTLPKEQFMEHFGKNGRFMQPALNLLDNIALQKFFNEIGVKTDIKDGFRVFPKGHSSTTVIEALKEELARLNVEVLTSQKVEDLEIVNNQVTAVVTQDFKINTSKVILATGGKGYPQLGSTGDGLEIAKSKGHKITKLYPAMMPLKCKESWVANCRADTIAKVLIKVDIKKYKKLQAIGDLIFTKDGIRGPVVLDFSREITPLLDKFEEVPILLNLTKGLNAQQIRDKFKELQASGKYKSTLELTQTLLPTSVGLELIKLAEAKADVAFSKQSGIVRDKLINLLAWTPLTVVGHSGFDMAMITRGGVSLKEVNPNTLESKLIDGLYFCGEILDLDGPCGGYNLQWAFASGYLAGKSS